MEENGTFVLSESVDKNSMTLYTLYVVDSVSGLFTSFSCIKLYDVYEFPLLSSQISTDFPVSLIDDKSHQTTTSI